jgi:predicted HTH transcriptional regulator
MENLALLVRELLKYPNELPWLEFKHDNYEPDMLGEDICALANGATLDEKAYAYFIWGINDKTHDIVGTTQNLQNIKKGGEELENWLRGLLSTNADFEYQSVAMDTIAGETVNVGVLVIQCAASQPVTFKKEAFIRVGSYTKKLKDCPALQSRLWSRLHNTKFEEMYAKTDLTLSDALRTLEYSLYFDLTSIPQPTSGDSIVHYLVEDGVLLRQENGLYSITNMGAILLAKRLSDFPKLSRKAIRIVQYEGNNRLSMLKETVGGAGYVVDFEGLMKFIEALIPTQEVISGAIRETKSAYPPLAIREAVANALIHQDFSVSGTGPTVEIFANRIEITNSGVPLVDVSRIIDNPPKSRNEKLASMMRRLRMCEELGTGWDKIVLTCELAQLPAPQIKLYEESTKVTLFSQVPFTNLSMEDRLWACYLHACIMYVQGDQLTNSSLRNRFGLKQSSAGSVSRLIKDAVTKGFIKPLDSTTSNKYMKYVPAWA